MILQINHEPILFPIMSKAIPEKLKYQNNNIT